MQQDTTLPEILSWLERSGRKGADLVLDSRRVKPGDVFVAVPGTKVDGRAYIRVAAARGASACLCERRPEEGAERWPLPVLSVTNLSERLGEIAAAFYGDPTASMTGFAVTGTNGKTTTTHWIAALASALGTPAAVIGTIGCKLGAQHFEAPGLTTPDAASLERLFSEVARAGAKAFALEASSIGLEQGRMRGAHFTVGVFTNLTRDHLDYHGTMNAYGDAKAILMRWPGLKAAVVNADDPEGERMAREARAAGVAVWAATLEGRSPDWADYVLEARNVRACESGMRFTIVKDGVEHEAFAPVAGRFNVMNLLEAAAALCAAGCAFERILPELARLEPPAGRMQMLVRDEAPLVVVDYSHTPDALEKALESLRPIAEHRGGRLLALFGCGGDRDPGKRPMMGAAAARLADRVIVTSDNPRSEDPAAIAAAVASGAPGSHTILDRGLAIREAVVSADARDVILVAGKGHEDYQEIRGVRHHFSDVEAVREAFNERRAARAGERKEC